ncbi:hypothetical protein CHUAL_006152 [Chamberlinius hualienensis]
MSSIAIATSSKRSSQKNKAHLVAAPPIKGILKRRSKITITRPSNKRVKFSEGAKIIIIPEDQVTIIESPLFEPDSGRRFILQRQYEKLKGEETFELVKGNGNLAARYIATPDRNVQVKKRDFKKSWF